ncbi:MAG: hypothetical protein ACW98K_09520, partial [Candidatus Kariarchaeaceae archaeon]
MLITTLILSNFIHSRLSIKVSTIGHSPNTLKLLTYNIFEYSIDKPLTILKEANADIIALQETSMSHHNGTPVY